MEPTPSLSTETGRIRRITSRGTLVFLLALSAIGVFLALSLPKFERIFQDLLGSADKLPALTKLVMNYQPFLTGLSLLIPLVGGVAYFRLASAKALPILIAASAAALLFDVILLAGCMTAFHEFTRSHRLF